jgi:Rha family phage regulatory protein
VVVSSLDIAKHFEKNHRDVLRDIRVEIGYAQNCADPSEAKMFCETTYIHEQNGQEYPMFLINRDGFMLLAMGFNGKKASEWKRKYIRAFNEMEEQIKTLLAPSYTITDEIARAKRWIEEAEERKQLAETNQILVAENEDLTKQLEEEKEFKKIVYDKGDNYTYSDAYRVLSENVGRMGRNKFIGVLVEKKIISESRIPYAKYLNKGYFVIKKNIIEINKNKTFESYQGLVTPKGLDWLINYFKKRIV